MNRTDSSCLCWKDIKCNQYSAQVEHMPEREAVLFALEWWSYHLFLYCLGSQDLNNFKTMSLFKKSQPLIITSMQMQWLISVFYLWFILEYIIHPICLILVVIPMKKNPPRITLIVVLVLKRRGERKWDHVYLWQSQSKLCKSEHHPEKWLGVRQILQYRCNLCSVKNTAESPGEYILC